VNNSVEQDVVVTANVFFSIIPEWVLYGEISAVAVRVYGALRRFADNTTGECFPSRKTLAMRCRISIRTLDSSLNELELFGAIKVTKRQRVGGSWQSNLYTVYTSAPNPQALQQTAITYRDKFLAQKTTLHSAKNDTRDSAKNDTLTKANNYRTELEKIREENNAKKPFPKNATTLRFIAKAFFNATPNKTDKSAMEQAAMDAAKDPLTGETNQTVLAEFLRLVEQHIQTTERIS
jgi:DNA-binding transcriptional regulator YhcF (GntR family)